MKGVPGGTGCSSGWRYNPSDKQRNNNSRSATHGPDHRQFRRANAVIQFATLATERGVPGRLQHGRARRRGPPIQASSISTSPRRGGTLNSYGNGHERCTFSP